MAHGPHPGGDPEPPSDDLQAPELPTGQPEITAIGKSILKLRSGAAVPWFYRAHGDPEARQTTDNDLANGLASGEVSKRGWVWTPGLRTWIPVGILTSVTGIGLLLVPSFLTPMRLITSAHLFRDLLGRLRAIAPAAFESPGTPADSPVPAAGREDPTTAPAWGWYLSPDHVRVERVSGETLVAEVRERLGRGEAGDGPFAAWIPGMWRWETASSTALYLARFDRRAPPDQLPDDVPGLPWRERLRRFPVALARQFHPRQVLADIRGLLLGSGQEKRSPWQRWRSQALWLNIGQYIPVIASIINKGWQVDLMRSGATGALPSRRQVGRHLAEGLFLWAMYLLYLIPQFLLLAATDFVWIEKVIRLAWWCLTFGGTSDTLGGILGGGVLEFLLESLVMLIYPVLCWPFYRGAMIRYALEDDPRVFMQWPTNWRFAKHHLDQLAMMYLWQKSLWGAYLLLSAILLATGIGSLLIPFLLTPLRLISSGVVYLRGMTLGPGMSGFFPDQQPLRRLPLLASIDGGSHLQNPT